MKKIASLFGLLFITFSLQAQSWSRLRIAYGAPGAGAVCTDTSGNVYIGGLFLTSGLPAVLTWNGTAWIPFGSGIPNTFPAPQIQWLQIDKLGYIYATGEFRNASNEQYVARWNGSTWSELGTGTTALHALYGINYLHAAPSGKIYVVAHTTSDTGWYNYVYRWDGSSWTKLIGSGTNGTFNGSINAVCADSADNVYAVGQFLDSTSHYYVAKWNGTMWSNLGSCNLTVNGIGINAITCDAAGNLYVPFVLPGFQVDKWNGISWSHVGSGATALNPNNDIRTLTIDRFGNLYAAGLFTDSVATAIRNCYVAKWNGSNWSQLGSGGARLMPNSQIWNIAVDKNSTVYAVGDPFRDAAGYTFVGQWKPYPTSVSMDAQIKNVEVYPNPAGSLLNMDIADFADTDYQLIDCTGRVVRFGHVNAKHTCIDITDCTTGVYILKVANEVTCRVVKQ